MLSLQITFCVALIFVVFGQEDCGYGTLQFAQDTSGAFYCGYYCYDDYLATGNLPTATDAKSRSFTELKTACPNIQAAIDHYGSASCSSTDDLVWADSCECPSCPCDQETTEYHTTAYFFKKECVSCQCAAFNTNGDKGWNCTDRYSVSNAYEWDHFTCDGVISCTSNDPTNSATYSPGDAWWESTSYDATCETFCYCQYDGTTYCETSYENIVNSQHDGLKYRFFSDCSSARGCQNDPDLLSGSTYYCGCPSCSCGAGKQEGDVEYVEYTGILFYETSLSMLMDNDDTYCMECVCSYSTRDCSDIWDLESYAKGTEDCPLVSVGECLTGDGNSTSPSDANDGAGLAVSDCYGSETFCGWSTMEMTGAGGIFNDIDYQWGCEDSIFCDAFSVNDGQCFHISVDYGVIVGASAGCGSDSEAALSLYGDVEMHLYQMCCSGTNCNNVEANTASCVENNAMQSWYDTYLQCLYGAEYQTHFCQERDAFTCQDLQALGTWFFGCDCAAFSTISGLSSNAEQQAIMAQEITNKIAEMDEWSALFGCSLVFSCDLSSGEITVDAVPQPTAATTSPTQSTPNPTPQPTADTAAPSISPSASPTIGTSVPTPAPSGDTTAPSVATDNPTPSPSEDTSSPTVATDAPSAVTSSPTEATDAPTAVTDAPTTSAYDPGAASAMKSVWCFVVLFATMCFL